MRVLIPELADDAAPIAAVLRAQGHDAVAEPLITAAPVENAAVDLSSAQGFLVTGPAAARALAARIGVRTFPVFADSTLTGNLLQRLGFKRVEAANDPQALARMVEAQLKPAAGALIHPCMAGATANVAAILTNLGFAVRPLPLFTLQRVATLPPGLRAALQKGDVTGAVFVTPEAGRAFVSLLQREELTAAAKAMWAIAISSVTAAPLRALAFEQVSVPEAGDESVVGAAVIKAENDRAARAAAEAEQARHAEEEARLAAERVREEQRQASIREAAAQAEREAAVQRERERQAADAAAKKAEAQRRAEAEREAAERARVEAEQRETERVAKAKAELEATERRKREATETVLKEAEAQRRAQAEREAAERARAEAERREAERIAKAKTEQEAVERRKREHEAAERERAEMAQRETERAAKAKAELETAERRERERATAGTALREAEAQRRADTEREAAERVRTDAARQEAERIAQADEERRARAAAETRARTEAARVAEAARLKAEAEQAVAEARARDERLRLAEEAREREARARDAREQAAREHEAEVARAARVEAEAAAARVRQAEQAAREKAEREAAEKAERERIAREIAAQQEAERERLRIAEKARIAQEQADAERVAREKVEREAAEKTGRERIAREIAAQQEAERERLRIAEKARIAQEQADAQRAARVKAEHEAAEKAERERAAREIAAQQEAERLRVTESARIADAATRSESVTDPTPLRTDPRLNREREAEERRAGVQAAQRTAVARGQDPVDRDGPIANIAQHLPADVPDGLLKRVSRWFRRDPPPEPVVVLPIVPETPFPQVLEDTSSATLTPSQKKPAVMDHRPPDSLSAVPPAEPVNLADESVAIAADESVGESNAELFTPPRGRAARQQAEDAADASSRTQRWRGFGDRPGTETPELKEEAKDELLPQEEPVQTQRRRGGAMVAAVIVLVAAAAFLYPRLAHREPQVATSVPAPSAAIADKALDRGTPAETRQAPPDPNAVRKDADVRPPTPNAVSGGDAAGSLGSAAGGQAQQLAALMARVATLEAALGNTVRLDELGKRIDGLEHRSADAASVLALSDRVQVLESTARNAIAEQTARVGTVLAVAEWREAMAAGRPFQLELESVKALGARGGLTLTIDDPYVTSRAASGIATFDQLRERFDETADHVLNAAAVPNGMSGWLARTFERMFAIVTVRRVNGLVEGTTPAAILARAGAHLRDGNLAAALTEMEALQGAAADAASTWTDEARARVTAERAASDATAKALAALRTIGTSGAAAPAPSSPPASTPQQ